MKLHTYACLWALLATPLACSSSSSGGGSLACTATVVGSAYCYTFADVPASVTAAEVCPGGAQVSSCPTAYQSGCCTGVPLPDYMTTQGYCIYDAGAARVMAEQAECALQNGVWAAAASDAGH